MDGNLLGVELKRLRDAHGLSLREAARRTGGVLSHAYLSQLELGKNPKTGKPIDPSPRVLRALSDAYGVSYERLLALAGYYVPAQETANSLAEDWPEGVQFLTRASGRLSPEMKRKMLRAMEQFLDDDDQT